MLCLAGFWGAYKKTTARKTRGSPARGRECLALSAKDRGFEQQCGMQCMGGTRHPVRACFVSSSIFSPHCYWRAGGARAGHWPRKTAQPSPAHVTTHIAHAEVPAASVGARVGFRHPRAGQSSTPWASHPRPPVAKPQLDAHTMCKLQELKSAPSNTSQHHSLQLIPASSLLKHIWTACKFN